MSPSTTGKTMGWHGDAEKATDAVGAATWHFRIPEDDVLSRGFNTKMELKADVESSIQGPMVPSGSKIVQHLSAASGLVLTYFIEIGVQIFLTFHLFYLLHSSEWSWVVFFSLTASSVVVSSVSLIWVCHSLDFAGRLCGRVLCYVMHVLLLGIPWRYLKLAFAYDPTDVQEFVALRIFQTFVQSLPLCSIHLAALLTFHQNWSSWDIWLVAAESFSVVISLVIAFYTPPILAPSPAFRSYCLKSIQYDDTSPSKTTRCFKESLKCSTISSDESVLWVRVLKIELNLLSRALMLICRIVCLSLLVFTLKWWAGAVVVVHLSVATAWMNFTMNCETWTITRSLESSYVMFWDISSTLCGELRLLTWSGPLMLILMENSLVLAFSREAEWLTVGTTMSQILGFALFSSLNLVKLKSLKKLLGTRVLKNDFPLTNTQVAFTLEKSTFADSINQSISLRKDQEKSLPGSPERTVTFDPLVRHDSFDLPDTCCHASNGSSNSRNTNTVLEGEGDGESVSDFVFCPPQKSQGIPQHQSSHGPIKTASRVIMNIPKHVERRSRCPCRETQLIEPGSYGIIFCEDKSPAQIKCHRSLVSRGTPTGLNHLRLRVLCAKCLQNHDPLLTECRSERLLSKRQSITLPSETTDYPSETEMTWTMVDEDAISEVTSLHSSFCVTDQAQPMWAALLRSHPAAELAKEFTSKEYVRTWLLSSQTLERHQKHRKEKFGSLPRRQSSKIHPIALTALSIPRALTFLDQKLYKDLEIIV